MDGTSALVYIDDILVGGPCQRSHDKMMVDVLDKIKKYGLKVTEEKSWLGKEVEEYLGYEVFVGKYSLDQKILFCGWGASIVGSLATG